MHVDSETSGQLCFSMVSYKAFQWFQGFCVVGWWFGINEIWLCDLGMDAVV